MIITTNAAVYRLLQQLQQQVTQLAQEVSKIMTQESSIEQSEATISAEITALNTAEQALSAFISGLQADQVSADDVTQLQSLAGGLTTAVQGVQGLVPPAAPAPSA